MKPVEGHVHLAVVMTAEEWGRVLYALQGDGTTRELGDKLEALLDKEIEWTCKLKTIG